MSPRKAITRDGSPTLYSERFDQHYHNMAGALTESRHVFFERTGLIRALESHRDFTVFETGFGTGLHLLLLEWLRRESGSRSHIRFYSVENYPVDDVLIRQMEYPVLFPGMDHFITKLQELADVLHSASSGDFVRLECADDALSGSGSKIGDTESGDDSPRLSAAIFRGDFYDLKSSQVRQPVHFFLHDAFSPKANPELWSQNAFAKLHALADKKAVLGTYASATEARAAMILAGWHVARCAGPPGKREMTLASPDETMLSGHKRVNEHRLRERFGGCGQAGL